MAVTENVAKIKKHVKSLVSMRILFCKKQETCMGHLANIWWRCHRSPGLPGSSWAWTRPSSVRLFFIFWIRSNKFCNFSGCRCSILISEKVIRFVCPLAFQCRIPNYSTAKTHKDMAIRKRKVENDCSAFLHNLGLLKLILRFLRLQMSDF